MTSSPLLDGMKQIVEDLAKAIGFPCEVVLHDYEDPSCSIVAISGNLTGRQVGGPLTDLGLRIMHSGKFDENLIAYQTSTDDGKPLRSSTLFLHDESGKVVGALCINIDLTYWSVVNKLVAAFCETHPLSYSGEDVSEKFATAIPEVLRTAVDKALQRVGQPVSLMIKSQKLEVVRLLDEDGVFLVRGAIDYIAEVLSVSRPTIYNYLGELRRNERFVLSP